MTELNLNKLNKLAGGNCSSIGEMFKKIGENQGVKKVTKSGVTYTELSENDSKEISDIFKTKD